MEILSKIAKAIPIFALVAGNVSFANKQIESLEKVRDHIGDKVRNFCEAICGGNGVVGYEYGNHHVLKTESCKRMLSDACDNENSRECILKRKAEEYRKLGIEYNKRIKSLGGIVEKKLVIQDININLKKPVMFNPDSVKRKPTQLDREYASKKPEVATRICEKPAPTK